ncbi:OmpA family protein [Marinivivus vitaminiproducens]|uniref:OmpA family protein n=1 Tax=Marinivivus vitaminiproducens TaxID=3035935 RepID=UPI0027A088E0|nr:OmpA family protein [Geminicoccaceae bacterium SCSIO 64248]
MRVAFLSLAVVCAVLTASPAVGQERRPRDADLTQAAQDLAGRHPGLVVRDDADHIRIVISGEALFQADGQTIRREADPLLRDVSRVLLGVRQGPIVIEGHADSAGSDADVYETSLRRAEAILGWLGAKTALNTARLQVVGRADDAPLAQEVTPDGQDDPAGRQRNRRVEIVLAKR